MPVVGHTKFGVWTFWCLLCCGLCLEIQALEERSPIFITFYTRTCQFVLRAGHCLCLSEFLPQWRTKWCFSKIGCLTSTGFSVHGDWKWTFWRRCWFVNQGESASDRHAGISLTVLGCHFYGQASCVWVFHRNLCLLQANKYSCLNLYFNIICLWVSQLFP